MKKIARAHGFSFVEIMVAVLVLAVCAVPMGDAVRNGLAASTVAVDKARELRCMKNTMEALLAEPYQVLWSAAAQDNAASYVLAADAACAGVARQLAIVLCEQCSPTPTALAAGISQNRRDAAMLSISLTSDKGYAFTTLVAR